MIKLLGGGGAWLYSMNRLEFGVDLDHDFISAVLRPWIVIQSSWIVPGSGCVCQLSSNKSLNKPIHCTFTIKP